MSEIYIVIILGLLVLSALLTVLMRNRLKAVIALAFTSALLTVLIFMMGAPLAAVFELSVCSGLITAIFISVLSLTHVEPTTEEMKQLKGRISKYIYLPVILIVVIALTLIMKPDFIPVICNNTVQETSVQEVIWNKRQLDIAGQIIIILAGIFGVVILFKERFKK